MGYPMYLLLLVQMAMYPGLGKLPLAPIPYDLPHPEYPRRIEIKPVRPSTPVIPGVIFRPPSEVLRNIGELRAEQPAEAKPRIEAEAPPQPSGDAAGAQRRAPARTSQESADPQLRPTRRQPLGW